MKVAALFLGRKYPHFNEDYESDEKGYGVPLSH